MVNLISGWISMEPPRFQGWEELSFWSATCSKSQQLRGTPKDQSWLKLAKGPLRFFVFFCVPTTNQLQLCQLWTTQFGGHRGLTPVTWPAFEAWLSNSCRASQWWYSASFVGILDPSMVGYPIYPTWLWINTYINTILRGMNIHLPAILMWTTGVLLVLTHCHMNPRLSYPYPKASRSPMTCPTCPGGPWRLLAKSPRQPREEGLASWVFLREFLGGSPEVGISDLDEIEHGNWVGSLGAKKTDICGQIRKGCVLDLRWSARHFPPLSEIASPWSPAPAPAPAHFSPEDFLRELLRSAGVPSKLLWGKERLSHGRAKGEMRTCWSSLGSTKFPGLVGM